MSALKERRLAYFRVSRDLLADLLDLKRSCTVDAVSSDVAFETDLFVFRIKSQDGVVQEPVSVSREALTRLFHLPPETELIAISSEVFFLYVDYAVKIAHPDFGPY